MWIVIVALAVVVPVLLELQLSWRHERALRARGAVEPPDDVYLWMAVAYPGLFTAMLIEGALRGSSWSRVAAVGVVVFVAAKAIKYAAIHALGDRWSFRVLVLPGAPLITRGPYRWFRHPNYIGVMGEMVGVALLASAPLTGLASVVIFGRILLRRIAVEERALGIGR